MSAFCWSPAAWPGIRDVEKAPPYLTCQPVNRLKGCAKAADTPEFITRSKSSVDTACVPDRITWERVATVRDNDTDAVFESVRRSRNSEPDSTVGGAPGTAPAPNVPKRSSGA